MKYFLFLILLVSCNGTAKGPVIDLRNKKPGDTAYFSGSETNLGVYSLQVRTGGLVKQIRKDTPVYYRFKMDIGPVTTNYRDWDTLPCIVKNKLGMYAVRVGSFLAIDTSILVQKFLFQVTTIYMSGLILGGESQVHF